MNLFGLITASGQPIFGIEDIKGFSSVFDSKRFWLLINNTIQNVFFVKETYFIPQNTAGSIIQTFTTKFLIPIQTAFFVLALRNRFRR